MQGRTSRTSLATERHDADRLIQKQIQRDALFGGASTQPEDLSVTAHQLHLLVGVHPAQRGRTTAQQSNAGVARQISGLHEVQLALGEQPRDVVGGDIELGHPGPAGGDDFLGPVLVGVQPDRAGLDPKRDVLADQGHLLALGGQIGRAAQDARVIGVIAESGRQHRGVLVVELDVQGAAVGADRDRLVQPAVFQAQIVEQAQRLPGEPTQFVVMSFGFQFADHNQRNDYFVLGEPSDGPGIRQQDRRVEHIGLDGFSGRFLARRSELSRTQRRRNGHVALLDPRGPAKAISAGAAASGPGPVLPS